MTEYDLEYIIKSFLVNPLRNWTTQDIDSDVPVYVPFIVTSSDIEDFAANEPYFLNAFVADVSYPSIRTFVQNYSWKVFNFVLDLNFASAADSPGRTELLRIANDLSSFFANPGLLPVMQYAMAVKITEGPDTWSIRPVNNIEDPGREFKFCVNPKYLTSVSIAFNCRLDPSAGTDNCYVCDDNQVATFMPDNGQDDYFIPAEALPIVDTSAINVDTSAINGYIISRGDDNYLLYRNSKEIDNSAERKPVWSILDIATGLSTEADNQEAGGYPVNRLGQIISGGLPYDPRYTNLLTREQTVEIGPTTFVFIDNDDVGSEVRNDFNLIVTDRSIGHESFQHKKKVIAAPISKPTKPLTETTKLSTILRATTSSSLIPTEAEWLAGNVSDTFRIDAPATGLPHRKAFAYTERPLISIRRFLGFESRDSYNPVTGMKEVIQSIDGRNYYTYVQIAEDSPEDIPVPFVVAT